MVLHVVQLNAWTCLSLLQEETSDALTRTVAVLLITAFYAVDIRITAPADGNAVTTLALELITVAPHLTAILKHNQSAAIFSSPLL